MLNRIRTYFSCDSGAILPVAALMMPVIIGFAGLGVDAGMWMMGQRSLQSAADAAAISAAYENLNGVDDEDLLADAALKEVRKNGYKGVEDVTMEVNLATVNGKVEITVNLHAKSPAYFSSSFFGYEREISASATSTLHSTAVDTNICFGSLEGNFEATGNSGIDAGGCSIGSNNQDADSCAVAGSSVVNVDSFYCSGGFSDTSSGDVTYNEAYEYQPPFIDPYKDLEVPEEESCDYNNFRINSTGNHTIDPGVYCGGMDLWKGDITMNPGVYIIDGGDFNVKTTVTGVGVTIILTSSDGNGSNVGNIVANNTSASLNLSAPLPEDTETQGGDIPDDYVGLIFYQDRIADFQNNANVLNGGTHSLDGAVYTPSRDVHLGGNANTGAGNGLCTQIVAYSLELTGTPDLGNENCESKGVKTIQNSGNGTIALLR